MTDIQKCKKCQLLINEGHAYELGGNRWHISCFKCSKCDNSLGCNSNFLVLGNGNLICSICSYNCKQCNKKIDDLAILTGDQAYCTNCFKCRACKQKIEDLRYARTSKGLFCMNCHEKLINKKKKHDRNEKLKQDQKLDDLKLDNLKNSSKILKNDSNIISKLDSKSDSKLISNDSKSLSESKSSFNDSKSSIIDSKSSIIDSKSSIIDSKSSMSDSKSSINEQNSIDSKSNEKSSINPPISAKFNTNFNSNSSNRISKDFSIEEINDSDEEIPSNKLSSLRKPYSINNQLQDNVPNLSPEVLSKKIDDNGSIFLENNGSHSDFYSPNNNLNQFDYLASPVVLSTNDHSNNSNEFDINSKDNDNKPDNESLHSPKKISDPSSQSNNKNVLLLSPNQFHDNEFHNASMKLSDKIIDINQSSNDSPNLDHKSLEPPHEDPKSRAGAQSPFAKANRQARVVESNDYPFSDNLGIHGQSRHTSRQNSIETASTVSSNINSFTTTPKKKSIPKDHYISPPPKLPLPSTPKVKSSNKSTETPTGLGLQGIEYFNEQLQNNIYNYDSNANNTPPKKKSNNLLQSVTNLEDVAEKKDEDSNSQSLDSQSLSRMGSIIRTPRLNSLKHKRSISGGSNSLANKFGFFRSSKDDNNKGHGRNFSDSSIVASEILHYVPLGTSPQVQSNSRDHVRTISDTGVTEKISTNDKKEYNSLKADISQMIFYKQALDSEIKLLSNEKYSLTEQVKIVQSRLTLFNQEYETLAKEIADLKTQKKKYLDINQSLSEQNHVLEQSWLSYQNNSSSNSTLQNTTGEKMRKVPSLSSSNTGSTIYPQSNQSSPNVTEVSNEEHTEPQRAARLKFWKRKAGNGNQANLVNLTEPSNNRNHSNQQASSSLGKPTSFANQADNNDYQNNISHNSGNNSNQTLDMKNRFVKSRSTNILDTFLNGNTNSSGNNSNDNNNNNNNNININNDNSNNNNNTNNNTNIRNNINTNHSAYNHEENTTNMNTYNDTNINNTNISNRNAGNSNITRNNNKNNKDNVNDNNQTNKNIKDTSNNFAPLYSSTIQQRAVYENSKVPLIITKCIDEVENRGLDTEGIYRISGGNSAIVAIENSFESLGSDNKSMAKLNEVLDGDINAVTSALKRYLRKLPEPLIPFSLYDDFIKVSSNNGGSKIDKQIIDLKSNVLTKLPPANKHALFLLCKHLILIDSYSSVNRMGFKNLSVVFAPTIARDKSGEREMLDMGYRNNVTELLLTNAEQIFDDYTF